MAVLQVDEAEFQLLEAALKQAEQQYAANFESNRNGSSAGHTASAVPASHLVHACGVGASCTSASTTLRDCTADIATASTAAAVAPPEVKQPASSSSGAIQGREAAQSSDTGGAASGGPYVQAAAAPAPGKRKLPASFVSGATANAAAAVVAQQLPTLTYHGAVQYTYTAVEVDALCQLLLSSHLTHCGFDIEWLVRTGVWVVPQCRQAC